MRCNFPEHHGASAGQGTGLAGLFVVLLAGGLIFAFWHIVLVALVVAAVLAIVGIAAVSVIRASRSAPYDQAWAEPRAAVSPALRVSAEVVNREPHLQARVAELEAQLAARQIPPAQHLHIHLADSTSDEDLARVLRIPGASA